ncbi:MAG: sulfite exporter TauE/SafE family protein [Spirochaetota bacterium]
MLSSLSLLGLCVSFLAVGLVSALIGLGGGTSYLAFMDLFGLPAEVIPIIALGSNIIVSGVGSAVRLYRRESISWKIMVVCLAPSMLMAYLGACLRLEEQWYRILLNLSILVLLLARLLLQRRSGGDFATRGWVQLFGLSGGIGFISGVIGIGGGIILGPVLHFRGMPYQRIPVITALYIFLNSIVGILPHLFRLSNWLVLGVYWYLPLVSSLTSVAAMLCLSRRVNSGQTKNIVAVMIALIAVYNLVRLAQL